MYLLESTDLFGVFLYISLSYVVIVVVVCMAWLGMAWSGQLNCCPFLRMCFFLLFLCISIWLVVLPFLVSFNLNCNRQQNNPNKWVNWEIKFHWRCPKKMENQSAGAKKKIFCSCHLCLVKNNHISHHACSQSAPSCIWALLARFVWCFYFTFSNDRYACTVRLFLVTL